MSWMFVLFLALLHSPSAEPLQPDPAEELDDLQVARALSLQLRGVVPSAEEMTEISESGLSMDRIDQWLDSSAFEEQVIRHHRSLFWNATVSNDLERKRLLFTADGVSYRRFVSQFSRGVSRVACTDWENTDVNQWNQPLSTQLGTTNEGGEQINYIDEGWVWVSPFWAPETQIKVCAFDAQTNPISDNGVDCTTRAANNDPGCGCGPNLQWCMTRSVQTVFKEAFAQELSERVRVIVESDLPYTELLTSKTMLYNGPLAFYYQHLDPFVARTSLQSETIPPLAFGDTETWVEVEATDQFSGALTAPGWLLRHQTNRGRASRYYEGFLCKTFVPPTGGIVDEASTTPDLSLKQGCAECHSRLEPWRAYWGRWTEVSSAYVGSDLYPAFSQECADCAASGSCSYQCRSNYMVDPAHADDVPYIGWYLPYIYLKFEQQSNPDDGPRAWVEQSSSDGTLAKCVTQSAAHWLYGWSEEEQDEALIEQWSTSFEASGLSYKELIRELITDPAYGRRR